MDTIVHPPFFHSLKWSPSPSPTESHVYHFTTCRTTDRSRSHSVVSPHLPLNRRVVRARQMISQPVSSIFLCSPLPPGTWRTPGLSIPWCCLPTSSSICLVFFPLSLCLARWFWPGLMNRRHVHTTAVCIPSQWSGGLHVVWLPAGSWHGLPSW